MCCLCLEAVTTLRTCESTSRSNLCRYQRPCMSDRHIRTSEDQQNFGFIIYIFKHFSLKRSILKQQLDFILVSFYIHQI